MHWLDFNETRYICMLLCALFDENIFMSMIAFFVKILQSDWSMAFFIENNVSSREKTRQRHNTFDLLSEIPADITVVTESGIATTEDVNAMIAHDVYCFLVGEALMREPSPGTALSELFDR